MTRLRRLNPFKKWGDVRWTTNIPLWASRPDHRGTISSLDAPLWLFLGLSLMALLNVVLWLGIGIVVAFGVIF